jgi:transposase-like protein
MRVLLLGEGNFSFTRGLITALARVYRQQQQQPHHNNRTAAAAAAQVGPATAVKGTTAGTQFSGVVPDASGGSQSPGGLFPIRVVSTSFDSYEDVISKYPEFDSLKQNTYRLLSLNKISEQEINIQFVHGVDSTKPISAQLIAASCDPASLRQDEDEEKGQHFFDNIIFNFPHLGYESAVAHSSLVAHIFHTVSQLLPPPMIPASVSSLLFPIPVFILSLTETQFELWRVNDMAAHNGLVLVHSTVLIPAAYDNYEMKRHHVGRSFRKRVDAFECQHYVFALKSAYDSVLHSSHEEKMITWDVCSFIKQTYLSGLAAATSSASALETSSDVREEPPEDELIDATEDKRAYASKKKRTLEQFADGNYTEVFVDKDTNTIRISESVTASTSACVLMWECNACKKRYNSIQGIRTHYYTAHILENGAKKPVVDASSQEYLCPVCGKQLANKEGYDMHMIAKHSDSGLIKSGHHVASKSVVTSNEDPEESDALSADGCECHICGQLFPDESALTAHIRDGIMPIEDNYIKDSSNSKDDNSPSPVQSDRPQCQYCQRVFKDARAVSQHMLFCKLKPSS